MKADQFEVFYDGDCPLCCREIRFLQKRRHGGTLLFTDISDHGFRPSDYGMSRADFMDQIRGRNADGSFVVGVEVFRQLYRRAGFPWLVRFSRLRGIAWLLDRGYNLFAKNRLRLTGRCRDGACQIPRGDEPGAHHAGG